MKRILLISLVLLANRLEVPRCQADTSNSFRYAPNWESVAAYEIPTWYRDAKFGIFIHWGPYAVPAFGNEWYPCRMYDASYVKKYHDLRWNYYEHHLKTYGPHRDFGYKDFIPLFKAEEFDPKAWMDLFVQAGAKYIVPVGEHHDGFAMYASTHTRWNALNMGPKRDVAGELAQEARARGLKFGISSHFTTNWTYYKHDPAFDTSDPQFYDLYGRPYAEGSPADAQFIQHFKERTQEMIDKYQPDLIWFDGGLSQREFMRPKLELLAYYYNRAMEWDKGVVYNYKNNRHHIWPDGCGVLDIERGKLNDIRPEAWQTDTSVARQTWGYTVDMIVKPAGEIIDDLIDIVSKNGNLLLNIGPKADGTIPEEQKQVLLEIGTWLQVNGEAIYGTRPWKIYGEGPTLEDLANTHMAERRNEDRLFTDQDLRFTRKGKDLYVICLGPARDELIVHSLRDQSPYYDYEIDRITMLGSTNVVTYRKTVAGLVIQLPKHRPDTRYACAFKIHFGMLVH